MSNVISCEDEDDVEDGEILEDDDDCELNLCESGSKTEQFAPPAETRSHDVHPDSDLFTRLKDNHVTSSSYSAWYSNNLCYSDSNGNNKLYSDPVGNKFYSDPTGNKFSYSNSTGNNIYVYSDWYKEHIIDSVNRSQIPYSDPINNNHYWDWIGNNGNRYHTVGDFSLTGFRNNQEPNPSYPDSNALACDENFTINSEEHCDENLSELQLRLEALKTTIKKINKTCDDCGIIGGGTGISTAVLSDPRDENQKTISRYQYPSTSEKPYSYPYSADTMVRRAKTNWTRKKRVLKGSSASNNKSAGHNTTFPSAAAWQRRQRAKILNLTDPKQQYDEYMKMVVTPRSESLKSRGRRRRTLLPLPTVQVHTDEQAQNDTSFHSQDDYTMKNMELESEEDENRPTTSSSILIIPHGDDESPTKEDIVVAGTIGNDDVGQSQSPLLYLRPDSPTNSICSIASISNHSSNCNYQSPTFSSPKCSETNAAINDPVKPVNPDCRDEDEIFILRCPSKSVLGEKRVHLVDTDLPPQSNLLFDSAAGIDAKSDNDYCESVVSMRISEKSYIPSLQQQQRGNEENLHINNDILEDEEDDEEMSALREILLKSMQRKKQPNTEATVNNKQKDDTVVAIIDNVNNNDDFTDSINEKMMKKSTATAEFVVTLNNTGDQQRRNVEFKSPAVKNNAENMDAVESDRNPATYVSPNTYLRRTTSQTSPKRSPSKTTNHRPSPVFTSTPPPPPTTVLPMTSSSSSPSKYPSLRCTVKNSSRHVTRQQKISPFSVDRRMQAATVENNTHVPRQPLSVNHDPVIIFMDSSENSETDEHENDLSITTVELSKHPQTLTANLNWPKIPVFEKPPLPVPFPARARINLLDQCLKEAREKSDIRAKIENSAKITSKISADLPPPYTNSSSYLTKKPKFINRNSATTMNLLKTRLLQCRQDLIKHKKVVSEDRTRLRMLESTAAKRKTDLRLSEMRIQKIKEELKSVMEECAGNRAFILRVNKEIQTVQSRADKSMEMQMIYEKQWREIQALLANHRAVLENKRKKKRRRSSSARSKRLCSKSSVSSSLPGADHVTFDEISNLDLQNHADLDGIFLHSPVIGRSSRDDDISLSSPPITPISTDISPLFCFKSYRLSRYFLENYSNLLSSLFYCNKIDSNVPFCPYALSGSCRDADCRWQHECDFKMSEVEAIADLLAYCPALVNNCSDGDSIVKCAEKVYNSLKNQMTLQNMLEDCAREIALRKEQDPKTLVYDYRPWRPSQIYRHGADDIVDKNNKIDLDFYCNNNYGGGGENNAADCSNLSALSISPEPFDSLRYYAADYFDNEVQRYPNDVKLWISWAYAACKESSLNGEIGVLKALQILCKGLEKNRSSVKLWLTYLHFYSRQSEPALKILSIIERAITFAPCFELHWLYWNQVTSQTDQSDSSVNGGSDHSGISAANQSAFSSAGSDQSDFAASAAMRKNRTCFDKCISILRCDSRAINDDAARISFRSFCTVLKLMTSYLSVNRINDAKNNLKLLLNAEASKDSGHGDHAKLLTLRHYALLWCALIYVEHTSDLPSAIRIALFARALAANNNIDNYEIPERHFMIPWDPKKCVQSPSSNVVEKFYALFDEALQRCLEYGEKICSNSSSSQSEDVTSSFETSQSKAVACSSSTNSYDVVNCCWPLHLNRVNFDVQSGRYKSAAQYCDKLLRIALKTDPIGYSGSGNNYYSELSILARQCHLFSSRDTF